MNAKTPPKLAGAPPRKSRLAAVAPPPETAPDHLSEPSDEGHTSFQDLNFKVPPKFHRRFKLESTLRGISMRSLLEASFQAYLEKHGGTMERPAVELIERD